MPRLGLAIAVLLLACSDSDRPPDDFDYDLVFRNGTLYLGGERLARGDLAVRGDRIEAVGDASGRPRREIDATGLVVAPGFVDLHNHSDLLYYRLGWLPRPPSVHANRNSLTQGVTTVVTGNCGSGPATPDAVRAFLREMDERPFGTNVAHLVPHGDLRRAVMGDAQLLRDDPRPSAAELERMRDLAEGSMRAGAFGLSTGLEYGPGARAETTEIVAIARVASRYDGLYASHTRHEGPDPARMLASYAEAIAVGEQAGLRAHISHIKLSGRAVHGMTDRVIALVEAARARGVRVTADQYPYPASLTTLAMPAPVELRNGVTVHERYCEGSGRETLRAGILETFENEYAPENMQIALYPWRWWLQGRTVADVAAERKVEPVELAMDLACGWPGLGIYFSQNEEDVRAFMQQPWVATASDGRTTPDWAGRFDHPRLYGTFPRKLRRYALELELVSLGFALRSMTELPADVLGLTDRGRLRAGSYADVVAFRPKTLRDLATFERPALHSEGIRYVLVNGELSIDDGSFTGRRAGRALRGPGFAE